MKKIISVICLLAMLFGTVSASADAAQIGDGKTVRISGNAGEANANIAIEVFKGAISDNVTHTTLETMEGNYTSVLVCHDQSKTDSDGNYSFEFNVNLPSGKYTAYLATEKTTLPEEEFVYISNTDFKTAALLLKSATDASDVYTLLETYPYELGIGDEKLDKEALSSVIYETVKEYPVDENSREKTWENIKKAVFVQKLNEGKITDIYNEENKVSALAESAIKDYYKKDYVTTSLKEDFTKRIADAKCKSYNDYLNKIPEAFILATVKNPNGNKNIENIMTEFETLIGIDASDAISSTWSSLAGKDYADLNALKEAFNSYLYDSNSGGGGGSSSKRGSVSATTGISSAPIVNPSMPQGIFTDIENVSWAKDAIVYLASKGIVSGYNDNTFKPDNNVKREEFVKLICSAFVKETKTSDVTFSDTDLNAWYMPYIRTAYAEGITSGMGDGSFGTGLSITRQDMAVMIYRAAQKAGIVFDTEVKEAFADDFKISDYAKEAVYALKNFGAINGVNESEFSPFGNATRAQAAKIIYTLCK